MQMYQAPKINIIIMHHKCIIIMHKCTVVERNEKIFKKLVEVENGMKGMKKKCNYYETSPLYEWGKV